MLFRQPSHILKADRPEDVLPVLDAIERMLADGYYLAGYLAYEAGFALEPALADLASTLPNREPLIWLGCYRKPEIRKDVPSALFFSREGSPDDLRYSLSPEIHKRQVESVRELIASGEAYQLNLTMEAKWTSSELGAELYERLLRAQPVPYAALLQPEPGWHIFSLSPELFFRRRNDQIRTRPMKGTALPGMDVTESRAQAKWLRESEKDRAENVMIVDLLRSDLGRICKMGSVRVTKLFEIEHYPTVLQMTSTIEGRLRDGIRYKDLFGALFPSGSIVGAPKIHAMRLLQGLEKRPRGIYTGAIGFISPHGKAEFNVAIRTVSLKEGKAQLGVGSGITFDSDPALEYAECMAKTLFLQSGQEPQCELIETLLLEHGTFAFLEEHIARMAMSAEYFRFKFDEERIRSVLQAAAAGAGQAGEPVRVRLLLNAAGRYKYAIFALESPQTSAVDLFLWNERTSASNRFLRHKTTNRALYDRAFAVAKQQGFADSLFQNTENQLTEGATHNVIASVRGEWLTPPLTCGVLPGIYRQHLLEQGKASERVLSFNDLLSAEAIFICNSVRGLRRVKRLVEQKDGSNAQAIWNEAQTPSGACLEWPYSTRRLQTSRGQ